MKIILMKGLPGSGKSTWAKQWVAENAGWRRVNKDSIRNMVGYRPSDEKRILEIRDFIIGNFLSAGLSVVVDDTNFHPKHEERIRELAKEHKAEVEIMFIDTPLAECILRDAKRDESVGEKVIKKMWRDYLKPPVVLKKRDPEKQLAIICDLDGTLCMHNGRSPYDVDKCDTDLINPAIHTILNDWVGIKDRPIIFVTGREEKYREKTTKWLEKYGFEIWPLYMRPTGDKRKDYIVKEEIYKTKIEPHYDISYVLDDRNQVVNMWRRNGLVCLQVAEGDF